MVGTDLWRCGSLGGNRQIKKITKWLVGALANTEAYFLCAGKGQDDFVAELWAFVEECSRTVEFVLKVLRDLGPDNIEAKNRFRYS